MRGVQKGIHDLGGVRGFGRIDIEENEPVFHHEWERRVFALTVAMGFCGMWTLDQSRLSRESLSDDAYLSFSYYHIWLTALCRLLREKGIMGEEEGKAGRTLAHVPSILRAPDVARRIYKGSRVSRKCSASPAFSLGSRIRTRKNITAPHTRLPHYIRGHEGMITHIHGAHIFPDTNALGEGEQPQWLYNVRFSGHDIWGNESRDNINIYMDCWESYLEAI